MNVIIIKFKEHSFVVLHFCFFACSPQMTRDVPARNLVSCITSHPWTGRGIRWSDLPTQICVLLASHRLREPSRGIPVSEASIPNRI